MKKLHQVKKKLIVALSYIFTTMYAFKWSCQNS